jgi:hypothetical protein
MTALQILPRVPDLSQPNGFKLCPIRSDDSSLHQCWGERCAAFLPLTACAGVCLLIERQGAK